KTFRASRSLGTRLQVCQAQNPRTPKKLMESNQCDGSHDQKTSGIGLVTCAAVGYRRRSTAKAAGADCQSAAGYQPAPQNLVRQPTPAQFFMGFRGPQAR